MNDAGFEKLPRSDTPLYGNPIIMACGFSAQAHPRFKAVVELAGLADVPLIWPRGSMTRLTLSQLAELADGTGFGRNSDLPRAVIVAGILSSQLHGLMGACKASGMKQALWATMTPASEKWTLERLLTELARERKALSRRVKT